jgi:hypothetical protein
MNMRYTQVKYLPTIYLFAVQKEIPMNLRIQIFMLLPIVLSAQVATDVAPLKHWPAPLYWQPDTEVRAAAVHAGDQLAAAGITPQATLPANSLVFLAMTPCRLLDTRAGAGFSGAFGPPSLAGGATRTFPIQSSTT